MNRPSSAIFSPTGSERCLLRHFGIPLVVKGRFIAAFESRFIEIFSSLNANLNGYSKKCQVGCDECFVQVFFQKEQITLPSYP